MIGEKLLSPLRKNGKAYREWFIGELEKNASENLTKLDNQRGHSCVSGKPKNNASNTEKSLMRPPEQKSEKSKLRGAPRCASNGVCSRHRSKFR